MSGHEVIDGQRTRLAGHYFDWGADRPPSRPCHETVILRGARAGADDVPPRGTRRAARNLRRPTEMHVDGFRFDLAATLARELHQVDREGTGGPLRAELGVGRSQGTRRFTRITHRWPVDPL
ncbi:MAG: hypothetical protein M3332_15960 [Actinomycetota bacterium]|nr:hypothetical protein [Actinomycetota bacterium]